MMGALIAFAIAIYMKAGFDDRVTVAESEGLEYSCIKSIIDRETVPDAALDIRDAMEMSSTIYYILAMGCLLSCMGGPILCIRWISIPF